MMLMQVTQTPAPTIPDIPPLPQEFPVIVTGGGPPEWIAPVIVLALIVTGILLFPVVRAWARRLEGKGSEEMRAELEALHDRIAELEHVESRLAELENRVEFSERLLARARETEPGAR